MHLQAIEQFRQAMQSRGLIPPTKLISDGKIHRCDVDGKGGKHDGAYKLHLDDFPAGGFENHKDGKGWQNWKFESDSPELSPTEKKARKCRIKANKVEREALQQTEYEKAAVSALAYWQSLSESGQSAYLVKKQVSAFGVRFDGTNIIVPVRDSSGKLWSLQTIQPDGSKRFYRGGKIIGGFHHIGDLADPKSLIICEGYATAASIYQATGLPVIIAFNAGNLSPIAKSMREWHPSVSIVIAGDNDAWKENNVGRTKGLEAVTQCGGRLILPSFNTSYHQSKPTDFNDLHCYEGLDEVRTQLQKAITPPSRKSTIGSKSKNQKQRVIEIAFSCHEMWNDKYGEAGITISEDGHYKHFMVRSTAFKKWLHYHYYRIYNDTPNSQAYTDALTTIEAECNAKGITHPTFYRLGRLDKRIYIDLANDDWQVIEISCNGWSVKNTSDVKFLRHSNMCEQVIPQRGGSIDLLKSLLNFDNGDQFVLLVGFILKAFDPNAPYPLLAIIAEQGSGKSELTKMIVSLVDPSKIPLRSKPKTEQDLLVAAKRNHLLAFDNLSGISHDLSDALCRIATGGGFSTRKLYTDDEEAAIFVSRPFIINGIHDVIERPDLLERTTLIHLSTITESKRRDPQNLWNEFERDKPKILGVLLDGLVSALQYSESVELSRKPRMVGYAKFVTAAEKAFGWTEETFLSAYMQSHDDANLASIDMNFLASAVRSLVEQEGNIVTQASELLQKLRCYADDEIVKSQYWPKTPNHFSNQLKRCTPQLRRIGIEVIRTKELGKRWIKLIQNKNDNDRPDRPTDQSTSINMQSHLPPMDGLVEMKGDQSNLSSTNTDRDSLIFDDQGAQVDQNTQLSKETAITSLNNMMTEFEL